MKDVFVNFFGLFFMTQVVLTQIPVDINDTWLDLVLSKPLIARNSGASIQVDITKMVNGLDDTYKLDKLFKSHTITAVLQDENGKEQIFSNESAYAFQDNHVFIKLISNGEIPKKTRYTKFKIRSSSVKLVKVKLIWKSSEL